MTVSANLGAAGVFVSFDASGPTLTIPDLSSPLVVPGLYENLQITLDDSKDKHDYQFFINVLLPEAEESGSDTILDAN